MAYNVKFLKGTAEAYANLASKDSSTFYFTGSDLYLGEVKLSNAAEIAAAITRISANEGNITTLQNAVGTLSDLDTTAKTDLVAAINEVLGKVDDAQEAGEVSIKVADSATDGYLKTYVISQNSKEVGKIDIPKDLVVTSGEVVVDPDGQAAGTYIKLTIANQEAPIYINVKTLVDVYTAQASATQVQLAVSADNVISATIVAGSVGTTELANSAVTTAKIADANVTKAKLESDVQTSLGKADSAVQTVAIGSANGTVAVDGTDVAVKGLASAAYKDEGAFDKAGAASDVLGSASDGKDAATVYGAKAYADSLASGYEKAGAVTTAIEALDSTATQTGSSDNGNLTVTVTQVDGKLNSVSASIASGTYDASGSAATAKSEAIAYTDTALTWGSF